MKVAVKTGIYILIDAIDDKKLEPGETVLFLAGQLIGELSEKYKKNVINPFKNEDLNITLQKYIIASLFQIFSMSSIGFSLADIVMSIIKITETYIFSIPVDDFINYLNENMFDK